MTVGTETAVVTGASVSHSRASIEQIESVAVDSRREGIETLLDRPDVTEAFLLQTCNRVEAYVVSDGPEAGRDVLSAYFDGVENDVLDELDHEGSLRHLMSVACGLESIVLGEDQILGQLRDAYEDARSAGGIGPTLEDAILKALHVGERARSETTINEGALSLGSAAVRFVESKRDFDEPTALIIGAGEIATLAAKALEDSAARILVANRTLPHAEHLAAQLETEASAIGLNAVSKAAAESDVVVSATASADYVVESPDLEDAGETCIVDIAQPRDVEPSAGSLANVTVYDLDAIESITEETRSQRRDAAEAVEAMIDDELDHLLSQYKRKRADQVISAMYEGAERIKARELRTAVSRLKQERDTDVSDAEREILESLADALVGQLLSAPTRSLRDAAENDDWSTISAALQLFGPGLEVEPAEEPTTPSGSAEEPTTPSESAGIPREMRDRMPTRVIEQLTEDD